MKTYFKTLFTVYLLMFVTVVTFAQDSAIVFPSGDITDLVTVGFQIGAIVNDNKPFIPSIPNSILLSTILTVIGVISRFIGIRKYKKILNHHKAEVETLKSILKEKEKPNTDDLDNFLKNNQN